MAKACAKHPERPGTADCRGCGVGLCASCAVLTPQGSWCSAECAVVHRALATKPKEDPLLRKAGWAGKIVGVFLAVLLVMIGIHAAAVRGVKAAKALDVLGRLFDSLEVLKTRRAER